MKEQIIEKIRTLKKTEEFNYDRFFLCGQPTDMPDDALLSACKGYLRELEEGEVSADAKDRLISILQQRVEEKGDVENLDAHTQTMADILANKDVL